MGETIILNSNAYDYVREASYVEYLNEKIYQEQKLTLAIQEMIDLNHVSNDSKRVQISAMYEAKVVDTVKAKLDKFVTFIKGVATKFMANVSKIFMSEKTYLKKYQDTILKKTGKDISFSYYGNYEKGIERITNTMLPEFDWNSMNEAFLEDGDEKAIAILMRGRGFTYSDGEPLSDQLKQYFTGYEDGETTSTMKDFNFRAAYDYCINFDKIKQRTNTDIANMERSANKIRNAIKNVVKEAPAAPAETSTDTATETKTESFLIRKSRSILEETEDTNTAGDDKEPASGKTDLKITDVSKAAQSFDKANPDQKTLDANANAAKDSKIDDVNKIIDKYINISKSIITAKWTASEQIAKDYMKIIHAHVKSYMGNQSEKGADKTADEKTTYNNNNNEPDNNDATATEPAETQTAAKPKKKTILDKAKGKIR